MTRFAPLACLALASLPVAQSKPGELSSKTGHITLAGETAQMDLPNGTRCFDRSSAQTIVGSIWHNPDTENVVGLVMPVGSNPIDTPWALIISSVENGYVAASTSEKLDPDRLLEVIREDLVSENAKRQRSGQPMIESIDWVDHPRYDPMMQSLSWSTRLRYSLEQESTVNFNQRLLGRAGQLEFTTLIHGKLTAADTRRSREIVARTSFLLGHRHGDYREGDKRAPYKLAGLVLDNKPLPPKGIVPLPSPPESASDSSPPYSLIAIVVVLALLGLFTLKGMRR